MKLDLEIPDRLGASALDAALEGLVGLAVEELSQAVPEELTGEPGLTFPPLYRAGVRYQREVGTERWLTPLQTLASGRGDCEDLASWRAAELRVSGEDPDARARVIRSGPRTWHAVVERGNGQLEDPSRELGMGTSSVGALADWAVVLRRTNDGGWMVRLERQGQGIVAGAPYAHDALADACELGFACGSVIPGLDIIAQIARGALDAVVPGAKGGTSAQTAIAMPRPATPGLAAATAQLTADGGSRDDIERVARQVARLVQSESSRKLRQASAEKRTW